jgi:uncharacterized protein YjbJ (UPF0337 family)
MNSDHIERKWKRFAGSILERLTNSPTMKDLMVGQIQERYRIAKAETEKRTDRWSPALKEIQRNAPHGHRG